MKNDIKNNFNEKQPLLWQFLYASQLKKLEKIPSRKTVGFLLRNLDKNIESAKTSKTSRELFHIHKEISFIFRVAPSVTALSENDLSYLAEKGCDLLKDSIPFRLKNDILCFFYNCNFSKPIAKEITNICIILAISSKEVFQTRIQSLALLGKIDIQSFFSVIETIIYEENKDSIFLKRKISKLLIELFPKDRKAALLLKIIMNDRKPYILQGIAESLHLFHETETFLSFYAQLILNSESAVICSAIKSMVLFLEKNNCSAIYDELISTLSSSDEKVIVFAINSLKGYLLNLKQTDLNQFIHRLKILVPFLENMDKTSQSGIISRQSKMALERLWCESDESTASLYYKLNGILKNKNRSETIKIKPDLIGSYDEETLGRVLSVLSQETFSIQLIKRPFGKIRLVKDAFYKFRIWRIIYEFTHPSASKRQSLANSTGRHFIGRIRSASSILSEESESRVPGEPYLMKTASSSLPCLPLVDDFISASEAACDYKIYSYEGITIIKPPENIFKKFAADIKISFGFNKFARLRNRFDDSYLKTFRQMGFEVRIKPYRSDKIFIPAPSKISLKLFSFGFMMPSSVLKIAEDLRSYFFSLYTNTLTQLSCFVFAFIVFFIGRHIALNLFFRRARNSFALCIGGWGTRGKSSVERLKTALFVSLGCSVFGKTTGSEAFITFADSLCKVATIPIFRPYDKATIWEQLKFIKIASKLQCEIFLWECMAISPKFVKVMQKSWMRDNIATITNTYVDHEEHQGPAGWNVAETMTNFVPDKGYLITAEKEMYPFLEDEANRKNCAFYRIDKSDESMLTSDIKDLFPYKEHPLNIHLILKLAEVLGIDREFALKGIIDNILPDIGVLKEYPPVKIGTKEITFISGMSANEKTACLYNWNEMRMRKTDYEDKKVSIGVLINNRWDRPLRSKIFAELLVTDLNADFYFLTGSNLNSFINTARKCCTAKFSKPETELFMAKFIIIENPKITPMELFKKFAVYIPENCSLRIMGIQNIKGIGTDICHWLDISETMEIKTRKMPRAVTYIFNFFDPISMIVKKKKANSVYKALISNSITPAEAVSKLKRLQR